MRRKNGWTHQVSCPEDDCEADINVAYYPGHRAQTYGPPERCYEAEGDSLDAPAECPKCGYQITEDDLARWCEELGEQEQGFEEQANEPG